MFSIIIPTYNRSESLENTVRSLLSLELTQNFEMIIVNDYPENPVKIFNDRRIKVIENERNLGRSASRNAGADAAEFPYLFFIDDDIEVRQNIFNQYESEYKKGFSAVFSNVRNVRSDGKYSFLNEFLNTRGAVKQSSSETVKSNYFTTAFCSVKKEFFNKIGRFDDNFKGYGWEDPELGIRIEANGGNISFVKTESILHYHDKDVNEWIMQLENSGENLKYLLEKYPSFEKKIHYNILTSILGSVAFNPLFFKIEKLKAGSAKGFFGRVNYSFLFYAALYRSLTKIKKQA